MLRRLRETGPVVLVPAIWTLVAGTHLGAVSEYTLSVAHVVMSVLLVAFVTLSWGEMTDGVLAAWRSVILVGIPLALAGTVGLWGDPGRAAFRWVALVGWQLLPGPALVYTGRRVERHPTAYLFGGTACLMGAVVTTWALSSGGGAELAASGMAIAGTGQTAGIVAAVVDY